MKLHSPLDSGFRDQESGELRNNENQLSLACCYLLVVSGTSTLAKCGCRKRDGQIYSEKSMNQDSGRGGIPRIKNYCNQVTVGVWASMAAP